MLQSIDSDFAQALRAIFLGSFGRRYGGDPRYVHIPDGQRKDTGTLLADLVDATIRDVSIQPKDVRENAPLCPGCYMVAIVDLAVELARANGQPLSELGHTLAAAFEDVAAHDGDYDAAKIESIALHE